MSAHRMSDRHTLIVLWDESTAPIVSERATRPFAATSATLWRDAGDALDLVHVKVDGQPLDVPERSTVRAEFTYSPNRTTHDDIPADLWCLARAFEPASVRPVVPDATDRPQWLRHGRDLGFIPDSAHVYATEHIVRVHLDGDDLPTLVDPYGPGEFTPSRARVILRCQWSGDWHGKVTQVLSVILSGPSVAAPHEDFGPECQWGERDWTVSDGTEQLPALVGDLVSQFAPMPVPADLLRWTYPASGVVGER